MAVPNIFKQFVKYFSEVVGLSEKYPCYGGLKFVSPEEYERREEKITKELKKFGYETN